MSGGCPTDIGGFFRPLCLAALLVVIGLATAPLAAQVAQPWPIKEFEVVNVEPISAGTVSLPEIQVRLLRDWGIDPDLPDGVWGIDPDFLKTVPLDSTARQDIEALFKESAELFEDWGFLPPALEPVVTRRDGQRAYRIYLVSGLDQAAGEHHWNVCDRFISARETVILLDADDVLTGGGLNAHGTQTVPHELFHAVQGGSPFFQGCGDGDTVAGAWLTEGQASAVGLDAARLIRNTDFSSLRDRATGLRKYSERLPVPSTEEPVPPTEAYRTSSLWRFLAEAPPQPGFTAVDYSYLARLLRQSPPPRDCQGEGSSCMGEVRGVDTAIRGVTGEYLRDAFARFMQQYAQYGMDGGRYAALGGDDSGWADGSFDHGCALIQLRRHPDSLQAIDVAGVRGRFDELSAQCWEVELTGFEPETEGGMVPVAIAVHGPPAPQIKQLTAVLARKDGEIEKATVLDTEAPRASWVFPMTNGERTRFLLANVAHPVQDTMPIANLNVTFTAIESLGSIGPGISSADAAAIDGTLPIELEWMSGHVFPAPSTIATHPDECIFRFTGWKKGPAGSGRDALDTIELQLNHPGPIGPGVYGVKSSDEPEFIPPEDAVGWFTGGFQIGEGNILADGHAQGFWFQSGTIEITSIVDRLVKGVVAVAGWRKTCCLPGTVLVDYGRPSLALAAEFSFYANERTSLGSERARERMALACLEQPPPETSGGDPSLPPPPPPPPPPSEEKEEKAEEEEEKEDEKHEQKEQEKEGRPEPSPAPPGTGRPDPGRSPSPDTKPPGRSPENESGGVETGVVNTVAFRVTGDVNTTRTLRGDELSVTGGCTGSTSISLGFHPRNVSRQDEDWTYIAFDSTDIVSTGQTGSIPLREVRWDHGTVWSERMQGRVANRFTGPGTLTLTAHDATMTHAQAGTRRMAGTLSAEGMSNREGVQVDLEADFVVNLSCGVSP